MKNKYLETGNRSSCYGCNACGYACLADAIEMIENEQGFLYPYVDEKKCIDCGKCEKVCPYSMNTEGRRGNIYQAAHKSTDVLLKSQSGGAFTAISDFILGKNGSVYGAVFHDDLSVFHTRAITRQERDKMCGSKYVQSIISSELLKQIEKDLNDDMWVLFTGTPCQSAMIAKNYGTYERLIVCDFICHGTPSPQIWMDYLSYISQKEQIEIVKAVFRNKRCRMLGNYTESYYTKDRQEYLSNDYAALFYSHLAHRESCFSCQFAQGKRYSDITIGGFLEPSDFDAEYDSSMILVNTKKGRNLFEKIKENIDYQKSRLHFYKNQPCLYHPVPRPEEYEKFWEDYSKADMSYMIETYASDEIKKKFHIEILQPGEEYK
ncbi:MAG: 4Fe-4S dicluster domain-containing protein [Lachnospiraceae bacterium]|nr:4Fe-4S dicluster domain-containing protein [Lachnospiraceae bacterium]